MASATVAALPDVELIVCEQLRAALPGTDVGTGLVGWRHGQERVTVLRTGGAVRYQWLDQAVVTVEARAASREAAAELAARAREALAALPWASPPGAVVAAAVEQTGPVWVPEPDGQGAVRLTWTVAVHPTREGGP